jgi:TRL-like protein family
MLRKSLRSSWLALALALSMPSCLFGNFGHPLDVDVHDTTLGSKVGEASVQSVLWLVAWGDSGTAAAAKAGGITTIRHMDQRTLYVLFGLYYKNTTIVYGD